MKFHSGTHSGTVVSGLETVNFSIIMKRGKENQVGISYGKKIIDQERGVTVSFNDSGFGESQAENMAEVEDMGAVEDSKMVRPKPVETGKECDAS